MKIVTFLILPFFLVIVSCETKNQDVIDSQDSYLIEATTILDAMNALPKEDLVKIHTRGCRGNCWPRETTFKLTKYLSDLEKTGHYASWDTILEQYYLTHTDFR